MRHDDRSLHPQDVEHARNAARLGRERVVGARRAGGPADPERLDDDRLVARGRELRHEGAVGERRAEQAGNEHDRRALTGHGHAERLSWRDGHPELARRVRQRTQQQHPHASLLRLRRAHYGATRSSGRQGERMQRGARTRRAPQSVVGCL